MLCGLKVSYSSVSTKMSSCVVLTCLSGDQIQGNAYTIVRLLLYHSKCLGPALDSNAGLYQTFQDNLHMLDDELCSRKEESGAEEQTRPPTLMQSVLTFYASLLQLLGYCCHTQKSAVDIQEISLEQRSLIDRTRHILKNLVSQADVTALLVMPFDSNGSPLLLPQYKKSTLLFVERVYGLNDPDYTLRLLTEAFLPDIKLALQFFNVSDCSSGLLCATTFTVFQCRGRWCPCLPNLFSATCVIQSSLPSPDTPVSFSSCISVSTSFRTSSHQCTA